MLEQENEQVESSMEEDTDNSEHYEDSTTSEDAEEGESEDTTPTDSEDEGARKRASSQIDRLKARIKELEKVGKKGSEEGGQEGSSAQEVDERYLRLDMKTEGVKTKKEQDIVLDYIREKSLLGQEVEVSQALKSMVVKEALAEVKQKSSVPKPSTRTSTQKTDDFDYWVKQAKKGNFPTSDAAMMERLSKARIFTK